MNRPENNKKNENKLLAGSIGIAAFVVAGATFAWFTSQDEVTNRLSAEADYNVAITESFTPPESWTPGQEVNKDVSAVNTGNIDSLVNLSLGHSFTVTGKGVPVTASAAASADLAAKNAAEITEDEAKAAQAGGSVIYNKNKVAEEAREASEDPFTEDGLYLFRREVKKTVDDDNKLTSVEYGYDGYYVKGGKYYRVELEDDAVAFKADSGETDSVDLAKVNIPTTGEAYVFTYGEDDSVTWTFVKELEADDPTAEPAVDNKTTSFAEAKGIRITYAGQDAASSEDDIVVYVAFDENAKDNYTYSADDDKYYYNYVLPAGEETKGTLINSVTLGSEVQNSAYTKLDYDLDVILESIQASVDEDKNYTNETAASWKNGSTVNGKQGTAVSDTNGKVTWAD
ncbi:BsaA family SipW-dependent biofilm matrix protein [Ruminococcus sp.]|uniref:BsaA family SipW-dependent biofilm matrix protein n=1 Tax=Ruminococcus sp. TaxID=41978 RepID=UPI0025E2DE97|nr:BsaA family SipW-dependent biofilm matrix protein [Ruminococcus sp.]MBQ8965426.1 hypothetical protein [Ruminococcus sp.]